MKNCTRNVFVGLDYHQNVVQVCVLAEDGAVLGNQRCINALGPIVKAAEKHGRVVGCAIEACVGAATLADALIEGPGWSVSLAHTGYVHRMKQSPDKSDYTDARLLADLMRVGYLPKVWLPPAWLRDLRSLVRYRQQLADERRRTKQRMGAMLRDLRLKCPHEGVGRWTLAWLQWLREEAELDEHSRWVMNEHLAHLQELEQRIARVEKRLTQATAEDDLVAHLMSKKGTGKVTAWVMRAEIGRFDRFRSGKQLSRFCGVSPRNASSGDRQADGGVVAMSQPMLRTIVIEAGQRLCNSNGRYRAMHDQMKQRGKHRNVIVAAVANRWIRSLYTELVEVERCAA